MSFSSFFSLNAETASFLFMLSVLLFFFYWICGGIFFAIITIWRLGRIRKARFSCLFSFACLICAVGASKMGLDWANEALSQCGTLSGNGWRHGFSVIFGCGSTEILTAIGLWGMGLFILGFFIMALSHLRERTWFDHLVEHIDVSMGKEEEE